MSRSRRSKKLRIKAVLPRRSTRIRPPPVEAHPSRGWKEITHISGHRQGGLPRKLKLCADCDVPQELIEALRYDGIPVETAFETGIDGKDDRVVVAWTRRSKRVLLTFNHRDFWSDTKHPLQKLPGMIIMAIPNSQAPEAALALAILYDTFARHFTLDWWTEMKVRVSEKDYVIKRRIEGRTERLRVKYVNDRLFFRPIG